MKYHCIDSELDAMESLAPCATAGCTNKSRSGPARFAKRPDQPFLK